MRVFVFHHAFEKPISAILRKKTNESLYVEFGEKFILSKFKLEDPVVVFITLDYIYCIKSGDIEYIIYEEEIAAIRLDAKVNIQNRSIYKRFPVSQFCDVREIYTNKKGTGILKNLSSNGMLLVSKKDFQLGDIIEISIYFGATVYFIEGKIVRKIKWHNDQDNICCLNKKHRRIYEIISV